jgi:signal peptidase II
MDETVRAHQRPAGPLSPLGLGVVGGTIILDQIAKRVAETRLPFDESIDVAPILSLHLIHNEGIAFSMLSAYGGLALIGLTLVISGAVLALWWRATQGGRLATIGYALIVGGALGNLADRVLYGYVIDFLLLHFGDWTLFVFNLADSALTVGAAILLLVHAWPKRP